MKNKPIKRIPEYLPEKFGHCGGIGGWLYEAFKCHPVR
jgi:hypothetical protein